MRFRFERNSGFFGRVAVAASVAAIGVLALSASPAAAGPTPDYGIDFVVIGDPGNRHVNFDEGRRFYPPFAPEDFRVGTVNYKYRMSRTEVTVGQWLEFVNAYRPYYDGPTNWSEFTSNWIVYDAGLGRYRAIAGAENFAANMGWRYAARFCNWLHNGKVGEQWAFENGAYDASTFGRDDNGNYTEQRERNAGAKFWIPSFDEWIKAMHWDPNKDDGEGGYWRYPTSSDDMPIAGPPGSGDTNTQTGMMYDVGSYPHVTSPWGLLDGSGGVSEWNETVATESGWRFVKGTGANLGQPFDLIDRFNGLGPTSSFPGLRLAGIIPSPGSTIGVVVGMLTIHRRRRR
ncbi:MAG: SUMF1/EgtB/PvdO family nonheme iron enzyme [Phycisphaeraceae bacterium]|nr:SUMF1/EgtB/PvdO family nonheme iron enzyme [Phycisphaeraceae bacterium]MCW5761901.1 SUMF1/EgtB/PvdO family nonheme iron enzyme [Phycisphaeraceae bacterium]